MLLASTWARRSVGHDHFLWRIVIGVRSRATAGATISRVALDALLSRAGSIAPRQAGCRRRNPTPPTLSVNHTVRTRSPLRDHGRALSAVRDRASITCPVDESGTLGQLINAYVVCPANCETLEFLSRRTPSELAELGKCPMHCGNDLEWVPIGWIEV